MMEILEELKRLTNRERLKVVEVALHLMDEELQQVSLERRQQLRAAAEALLPEYAAGGELTVLTALDGEDFHASS